MDSRKSNSEHDAPAHRLERRCFLKQASLVVAGVQASAMLPFASRTSAAATLPSTNRVVSGSEAVAETTSGKVRGTIVDGIRVFKGIPYGGTTAGKNRFMPPTKPAKWTGIRDATNFGHIAPQTTASGRIDYVNLIHWLDQPGGQSEDCLVLNVWTPGIKDNAKRPVLVSLHGGGFATGSGGAPGYNGHPLAKYGDVVVVTINHRLGCLGYLHLADLGAPPEFAQSGVVGMLDCVAALGWVRDNIESFGGNPANVMVFGQSGGGAKTSTLLSMPVAKGLFHRAAIQSGPALRLTTRENATKSAERFLAQIGLTKNRIRELQDVPFAVMVAAQDVVGAQTPPAGFAPVVDGAVIPRHPFDPTAPEVSADVPIIVSTTLDDAALGLTNFDLDEAGLKTFVKTMAADRVDQVLSAYRKAYPNASPFLIQARILTDRGWRRAASTLAERKAALHWAPAYMYLFTWPSPGAGGKFGAVHGIDVGLTFHNYGDEFTGHSPEVRAIADKLASAWMAFAKTGNPNHPGLPEWPTYAPETRPTMIFDKETRVENDPLHDLRLLWEGMPT
jgi:para-nitrobenzyl esterase